MSETVQRKILVIDDSKTNLILLKAHLNNMGLVALLADNALEGISIAIDQKPDIILLDVMMPEIDGFETCRRLKADNRTSSIPVIFVSAKDQSEDKISGLKLGAIDYVTKPFNKGELQARIGIVLQMMEFRKSCFCSRIPMSIRNWQTAGTSSRYLIANYYRRRSEAVRLR
jgi:DNA-binding response OmpR family regulator